MRPVSDQFLRAVRSSHVMKARATVVESYQNGVTPTGTEIPIVDGNVSLDGSADIRSTLDLTTKPQLWPDGPADLLTPYGNEVFVQRGIEIAGSTEWVSLGYFRIENVEQSDVPHGSVRISGADRMARLVEAKLLQPQQFGPTTTVEQVFDALVLPVLPAAEIVYDWTPTDVIERTIVVESDRFTALKELARSFGKIMYFDHAGRLQIKDLPDIDTPVFDIDAGPNGVLISLSRSLSREGLFNATIATGEAPDDKAPVTAIARDLNPSSPTYWFGDFGQVPREPYSSPWIVRRVQAEAVAYLLLAQSIGLPYAVDLSLIPNPALEPHDVVAVIPSLGGNTELHTLESLNVPLTSASAMDGTTKNKTDVELVIE